MPKSQIKIGVVLFLLGVISWRDAPKADAQTPDAAAAEGPRAVVTRWLELHRTGNRDEASALTTGSDYHRAHVLLPSRGDTGVRVARSLGNQRVAAVVTNALNDADDGARVLLFWLVRRDGAWRINKSHLFDRQVVDERLRGFLEAEDVRWHVQRNQLLGNWEAGPCTPPGGNGVACGSRLQLGDDNRYRLTVDGPGGPVPEYNMQGKWQVANGEIVLSHQDRLHVCRVVWMADNLLVIEPLDKRGEATGDARYERADAARDQHDAATPPNATRKVNSDEKAEGINWQIARTRKQLSEAELEQLLKDNVYLTLDGLESITDKQAEMLGNANGFSLASVKELSDRQVESLSQSRFVSLNGLTALTDNQAKSLGNCEHVSLDALESITSVQCESLQNLELLDLNGLKSISNESAVALGKVQWLQLNGLKEISVKQIEALSEVSSLQLNGLKTLTDAQFVAFGKSEIGQLILGGLHQLTDAQAEHLSRISDLHLGGLKSISDRQAELLGKCTFLGLNGLTELSDPAAAHLGDVGILHLGGIDELSDRQWKSLSRCFRVIGPEAKKLVENHR